MSDMRTSLKHLSVKEPMTENEKRELKRRAWEDHGIIFLQIGEVQDVQLRERLYREMRRLYPLKARGQR